MVTCPGFFLRVEPREIPTAVGKESSYPDFLRGLPHEVDNATLLDIYRTLPSRTQLDLNKVSGFLCDIGGDSIIRI